MDCPRIFHMTDYIYLYIEYIGTGYGTGYIGFSGGPSVGLSTGRF